MESWDEIVAQPSEVNPTSRQERQKRISNSCNIVQSTTGGEVHTGEKAPPGQQASSSSTTTSATVQVSFGNRLLKKITRSRMDRPQLVVDSSTRPQLAVGKKVPGT